MRVIWTDPAIRDLASVRAFVEQDDPEAARGVALRIVDAVKALAEHPGMGRPGRVKGTRELVICGTHYIVPYRVREHVIDLLRVLHTAQRWPKRF